MTEGKAMPSRLAYAFLAVLAVSHAQAAPVRFTLAPGPVQVGFRAYGLGMLPLDGGFTRFGGTLTLDDTDPAACRIDLHAEAGSLRMPQQSMTDDALGPDLLDVARYPEFTLTGDCAGPTLQATLLAHGVAKPLPLAVTKAAGQWTATGTMRRADWGMGARPLLAGPEVRITITAGLPR